MSDEMFQALMIPVFVFAFWLLVVKPLAWMIRYGIARAKGRHVR